MVFAELWMARLHGMLGLSGERLACMQEWLAKCLRVCM